MIGQSRAQPSDRKNDWLVVYVLRVSVHRCDRERAGCYARRMGACYVGMCEQRMNSTPLFDPCNGSESSSFRPLSNN